MRPELTVAAIIERQGRFMLVEERVNGRQVLNQPAGHVEPGESILDAVVREALEETAWTFVPEAVVGIYLWGPDAARAPFLRVAFCGSVRDHQRDRPLDEGIIGVVWLTRSELVARAAQLRSPMVLQGIDDYLAGARHSCHIIRALQSGPAAADPRLG